MSFLKLNGIEIPVAKETFKGRVIDIGDRVTAFNGSPYSAVRRRKFNNYTFSTTPLTQQEALAFTGLINGDGDQWMQDTDSSGFWTQQGAAGAETGTVTFSSTHYDSEYGTKAALFDSDTDRIRFTLNYPQTKTISLIFWNYLNLASPLTVRYIITDIQSQHVGAGNLVVYKSDLRQYWDNQGEDGEYYGDFLNIYDDDPWTVDFQHYLTGGSRKDVYFDNVVILPYSLPAIWCTDYIKPATNHNFYASLPYLQAEGDAITTTYTRNIFNSVITPYSGKLLVKGSVTSSKHININGTIYTTLDCEIEEF